MDDVLRLQRPAKRQNGQSDATSQMTAMGPKAEWRLRGSEGQKRTFKRRAYIGVT